MLRRVSIPDDQSPVTCTILPPHTWNTLMRIIVTIILFAAFHAPALLAAPDPAEIRCGANFSDTQDIERCLAEALAQAEQKLAQAHEQLLKSLRQAQPRFQGLQDKALSVVNKALSKAQQAWSEFKDSQCSYLRDLHGTLGEDTLEHTACALKMVRERTEDLLEEARFWSEKFPVQEPPQP